MIDSFEPNKQRDIVFGAELPGQVERAYQLLSGLPNCKVEYGDTPNTLRVFYNLHDYTLEVKIGVDRYLIWSASIDRPPEVEERLIPGHWEGDLIKGAHNRSSVGTLVERTTLFTVLAKMEDASAASAVKGFGHVLNRIEAQKRLSMTYDQGKEMAGTSNWRQKPASRYTLPIRIDLGSADGTRTPTDWRGSTCQRGVT